jgi:hypothetical protein
MPRLHFLLLSIGLVALLSGCQFQLPGGKGPDDVTPNAVAGDAIEVTDLDAPASVTEGEAVPPPGADPAAKPQSTPPAGVATADPVADTVAEPAPQPDLGEAATDPAAATEPVPAKSEKQLACEKKKGRWVSTGGKAHTCVFTTKDANKHCTRESQCEGACLARSGTCSPVKPLLGCNEILQDNGARVTLCIE